MDGEPNLRGHCILIVDDDFFLAADAEIQHRNQIAGIGTLIAELMRLSRHDIA